jgi:hypothetical protein
MDTPPSKSIVVLLLACHAYSAVAVVMSRQLGIWPPAIFVRGIAVTSKRGLLKAAFCISELPQSRDRSADATNEVA